MRISRAQGFILKSYDFGEYDRLYLLYTNAHGKLLAKAHGIRFAKNLLGGHLLTFLPTSLLLKERQGNYSILEAQTAARYSQTNLALVARLHLVAEIIDRFTELYSPDHRLFNVLSYASHVLGREQIWPLSFLEILAKVLAALGVAPSLSLCVLTNRPIKVRDPLGWSSVHGGLVLYDEAIDVRRVAVTPINSPETVKLLRLLLSADPLAHRLRATAEVTNEAERLILEYIQVQLQTNLRALPFLHSTDRVSVLPSK